MTSTAAPFTDYEGRALPLDLDGVPYTVTEHLGAWRLTRCCGAAATGVDDGIVCKHCFEPTFDDGPARLDPLVRDLALINAGAALAADVENDLEERGYIVQTDAPYATLTDEGRKLIEA